MGCFQFLKVMMFIFNGIIFLAGAGILGVGVWVKVDSNSLLGILGKIQDAPAGLNQLVNVGYLLIAVGGVLLVMGFLGCCGAVRESKCMLLLFFVIVLIVFIAEVAAAVVILVFRPLAESLIHMLGNSVVSSIKKDYGKDVDLTLLWNTTMTGLKCCGFSNYTDFTDSPYHQSSSLYPDPCCLTLPCTLQNATSSSIPGCLRKIVSAIQSNSTVLIAVALGIAALEMSAMIVSMTLYCKIGSE
ncbi:tetraspanin 35 [Paramormyrops kingsleyae]|uniref:Tetraspanin n=1 Tax=Paramormyrops kingsleyae TaxID=1676925 RepID=A0A3B3S5V6_9TELE|nr:tetraspanin-1-like [Paramormyrops kingsleyae]XP_023666521.1 tetraspanin-1-like [Paramormyrops kingsleyae]